MAPLEDMSADRMLDVSRRIADHLLDVQSRVNRQIDAMQADLLPGVQRQLGYQEVEAADLSGLVNTRIAGLTVVVTPEAVATVLPLSAASATTTRPGHASVAPMAAGAPTPMVA